MRTPPRAEETREIIRHVCATSTSPATSWL